MSLGRNENEGDQLEAEGGAVGEGVPVTDRTAPSGQLRPQSTGKVRARHKRRLSHPRHRY